MSLGPRDMRRPSVLFLNRVYPPGRGATGRVLRDLARAFAKEGWHVTIITTGPKRGKERDGSIRVIRLKGSEKPGGLLGYSWVWMKIMFAALRLSKKHLVVTMTDPPMLVLVGNVVAKFKGSRHIHWCQDLYPDVLPALGFKLPGFVLSFFKSVSRRAIKSCDKVIVIGRCMARHLTYDDVDPKRITMIPNWPDFELVRPANANKKRDDKAVNGASHADEVIQNARPYKDLLKSGLKFKVLYAGNIGKAHPIDTILDAAETLNAEHPEIEFVFVGDGKRFDILSEERTRRGLENIRLLPYQPASRLRETMESGDVHLISMKEEAAGYLVPSKLYSALAVNRPCVFVGPEQSEAAKVIHDFGAGTIVPQGRADELAKAIVKYRMSGEDWFAAQSGSASAGEVFVPKDSIEAWMKRAWDVVEQDLGT